MIVNEEEFIKAFNDLEDYFQKKEFTNQVTKLLCRSIVEKINFDKSIWAMKEVEKNESINQK